MLPLLLSESLPKLEQGPPNLKLHMPFLWRLFYLYLLLLINLQRSRTLWLLLKVPKLNQVILLKKKLKNQKGRGLLGGLLSIPLIVILLRIPSLLPRPKNGPKREERLPPRSHQPNPLYRRSQLQITRRKESITLKRKLQNLKGEELLQRRLHMQQQLYLKKLLK